jgi:OmpA-OmpF porin, OOP family
MSQINQDDDQNYVLGIVGAIILAVLIGVVSLSINVSNSLNNPESSQISEKTPAVYMGNFDFSVVNDKLTLSGEVVDEKAKASLLNPAKLLWGADNVIDQLSIKADTKKFWWNIKPFEVLSKLKQVPEFKLHLGDNKVSGSAIVGSEVAKEGLLAGLKSWFTPDAQTDVNIEIDPKYATNALDPNTLLNLSIEYATGASEVPDTVKPVLNQIAAILKDDAKKIAINGHTDNVGVAEENKTLSLARADKIKAYLVSQGVDAGQLNTAGFGDSKPIADNSSESGKAKNRRIEFSNQ